MATDYTSLAGTMLQQGSPLFTDLLAKQGQAAQEADAQAAAAMTDLANAAKAAQTQAEQAQQQANAALKAPVQQTNPMAALAARSLGGIADVLSGDKSGTQTAEQQIQQKDALLLQRRKENLVNLVNAATKAADRAQHLGDVEAELKFRQQTERYNAQLQSLTGIERERIAAESRLKAAELGAGATIKAASIRQGLDRLPPELQAVLKPIYSQYDSLSAAKEKLLGATKKPDQKRIDALDSQMNDLQTMIDARIQAYSKPAGGTGLTYGSIADTARQQGVLTIEDFNDKVDNDPEWRRDILMANLKPGEVKQQMASVLPSKTTVARAQRELMRLVRENSTLRQPVKGPLASERTSERQAQAQANAARIKALIQQLNAWGYDVKINQAEQLPGITVNG